MKSFFGMKIFENKYKQVKKSDCTGIEPTTNRLPNYGQNDFQIMQGTNRADCTISKNAKSAFQG